MSHVASTNLRLLAVPNTQGEMQAHPSSWPVTPQIRFVLQEYCPVYDVNDADPTMGEEGNEIDLPDSKILHMTWVDVPLSVQADTSLPQPS